MIFSFRLAFVSRLDAPGSPPSPPVAATDTIAEKADEAVPADMAVQVLVPHNFAQINSDILQPACAIVQRLSQHLRGKARPRSTCAPGELAAGTAQSIALRRRRSRTRTARS